MDKQAIIFNLAVIIQIIVICLDTVFFIIMVRQKESRLSKLMLCIAIFAVVQNAAYLLELFSDDLKQAMLAVRIEYIGAAFITTFLFVFALRYCEVEVPVWIQYILFAFDGLVLLSVWTYQLNPLYYKEVVFINSKMPELILVKGPLYYANTVKLFVMLTIGAITAVKASFTTEEFHMKISCILLAFCSFAPFIGYVMHFYNYLDGYDPVPAVEALVIFIFGLTIVRQHVFDIASTAYENIIEEMQEAVVIIDKAKGYIDANKSAKELFSGLNYNKKGKKIADIRFAALLEACVGSDVPATEYQLDDNIYEVHLSEIVNKRIISGYIVSLFDITEERRQLDKMKQLKIAADEANHAKSDFLARMSHEIRSPINAVIGMNEMILRESNEDVVKEYAFDVKNSANTLLSIINDLLDSSKIESGKMEIIPVNYKLKPLFKDLKNMISVRAKEKGLLLKMDIDENLPSVLFGDDVRLKQILVNIMTNAVKYTKKGSITFIAKGKKKGNKISLHFSVEDTGIGIKEENIPHLFDAFERISVGQNRYIEGTGLGLNITSHLLKYMNSELKVESTYGKGSRFYFNLEQDIVDETAIGKFNNRTKNEAKEYVYKESFTAPDARILVVDDSRINLRVFAGLLKKTKVQITCAENGAKCLDLVRQEKFDLIFLDHMMPEMDGIEVLNYMKKMQDNKCENVPVIMLTANATSGAKEDYIKQGFDDFLTKPIDAKALEEMIVRLLPKELIV